MSCETGPSGEEPDSPSQSAFFRASHEGRYLRQQQIRAYESLAGRALLVFWGPIHDGVITPFADAVKDLSPDEPLDLMLTSRGGDGEAAKRLAAMCHAHRTDFRVVVPDIAASAATLLALAAESVLMSDTSRLGPIDPQVLLPVRGQFVSAKGIVEIVEELDQRTRDDPQAFPLYAALLADVEAIAYQIAKDAIRRTYELVPEVLRIRDPAPSAEEMGQLATSLQKPAMHSASIGHAEARDVGVPVEYMSPHSETWDELWRLHARYAYLLGPGTDSNLIEGRRVSFRFG